MQRSKALPVLEGVAEAVGSAVFELLYWGSIRPRGACAIAATSIAIAYCVKFGSPGSWTLGIGLTLAAAIAGYGLGWGSNQLFIANRPARVVVCVLAACVTLASFAWLIFGG